MSLPEPVRFVSVKTTPVARAQAVAVPDTMADAPSVGAAVVIRTDTGTAVATVVRSIPAILDRPRRAADAPVRLVRSATHDDVVTRLKQERREQEATRVVKLKIHEHGLSMKLSRVEHAFDGSRLVVYFTAEARVDFRELVRDLVAEFGIRVEMHQIGVRDDAKAVGGYGNCGRPLCCTTFLTSFEPVSIKMAKRQDLSLNPSKLTGLCGRLKCCLRFELPNAAGQVHAGCGSEGGCGNPTGCGSGGSGGSCGSCG